MCLGSLLISQQRLSRWWLSWCDTGVILVMAPDLLLFLNVLLVGHLVGGDAGVGGEVCCGGGGGGSVNSCELTMLSTSEPITTPI